MQLVQYWIDDNFKEWDEHQYEDSVKSLHLIRFNMDTTLNQHDKHTYHDITICALSLTVQLAMDFKNYILMSTYVFQYINLSDLWPDPGC